MCFNADVFVSLQNKIFTMGCIIMSSQVVIRGSDILTTVSVDNLREVTANELNATAALNPSVPKYKPDGCGVILLFHTPDHQIHGLAGLRNNPALKDKLTSDGALFPDQVNTTIGGKLSDPNKSLHESIMSAIKYKMFYENMFSETPQIYLAQKVIKSLIDAIEAPEGWSNNFCVHTDSWTNKDGSTGTMCFITAIKHVNCTYEDLEKIKMALATIMDYKNSQGEAERNISDFDFYPFLATMRNATNEYLITRSEVEKAEIAYLHNARVTFNDLCLEAFRVNNSYTQFRGSVDLTLDIESPALSPAL